MNTIIVKFKEQVNKWCAECGTTAALWHINDEYHYARAAYEKAAWYVLIADILRRHPEYAKHLPKLPEINH